MSRALRQALAAALKPNGRKAAEDDEEVIEDTDDEETSSSAEDEDDTKSDAEDDDETEPEAAEDDDTGDDTGEEKGPAAAVMAERRRCVAIFTHANAESNPKLAARLLTDGTPAAKAVGYLDAAGSIPASAETGKQSLAQRVPASQVGKKPGQDAGGKTGSKKDAAGEALVNTAGRFFKKSKGA